MPIYFKSPSKRIFMCLCCDSAYQPQLLEPRLGCVVQPWCTRSCAGGKAGLQPGKSCELSRECTGRAGVRARRKRCDKAGGSVRGCKHCAPEAWLLSRFSQGSLKKEIVRSELIEVDRINSTISILLLLYLSSLASPVDLTKWCPPLDDKPTWTRTSLLAI